MPVSTTAHLMTALHFIIGLQPRSVLDVGCGFGTWGFLCREHLDVFNGRVWPKDWEIRIDAVEFFEPYIMAHQRALYNNIRIADIREASRDCGHYDLIVAGDVIEHLEKKDAEEVLDRLYLLSDKALLVNIPLGPGWTHPAQYGNPAEEHRSAWEEWEFAPYRPEFASFTLSCGAYGCFFCKAGPSEQERVDGYLHLAGEWETRGDLEAAERALNRAASFAPGNEDVALYLADFLLRQGRARDALPALARTVHANPKAATVAAMHAKLREALKC